MVVVIEIPCGSKIKYEHVHDFNGTGVLAVDRINSMNCPANYGYISGTLSEDGDPTDAFVVSSEPLQPLSTLKFEPLFLITMSDNGEEDNKYVGRILGDDIDVEDELVHILFYLENYKSGVVIGGVDNVKS